MARAIKEPCPEAPKGIASHHPDTIPKKYVIEVITPLFGGGVDAGKNDPITLIRPSSIRGHLRFWWRATTRGTSYKDIAALRQREGEIWGTTKIPSAVKVFVECPNKGKDSPVGAFEDRRVRHPFKFAPEIPPYTAFPSRPQYDDSKTLPENNEAVARVKKGVKFTLQLEFSSELDLDKDVQAAVTAWVNFGGIGARTRRGFGALYCKELAPNNVASFGALIKTLGAEDTSASDWPVLFHGFHLGNSQRNHIEAWQEGVKQLQDFRQSPPVGRRNGSGGKHGRSHWPEAEAVRNLVFAQGETAGMFTGSRSATNPSNWHGPDTNLSKLGKPPIYFPRAEFGLPIIWEIKDERLPGNNENLKPTLQYDGKHDRMASPLIIRPIRFQDGTVCPLFLQLRTPLLNSAYLKPGEKAGKKTDLVGPVTITRAQICNSVLDSYPNSPLGKSASGGCPRSSNGSALEAFFEFLK